jgi:hypothetical protein
MAQTQRQFAALLGRLGKPEAEFNQPWIPGTTIKSPAGLRTDKFITALILHWHGRITIATAAIAALTVDSLGQLLQEIRVYGQHAVYGNIRPFVIRGGHVRVLNKIYRQNYVPRDQQAITNTGPWLAPGAAQAVGTYDLDVFWTCPLFPLPMSLNLAPMYSLKGPDWAGNLFLEVDAGDATALGGVVANTTFSAHGSGAGNPTLFVSVLRPNLGVPTMNRLSPAICFKSYKSLDSVVQGPSGSNSMIATLNIGKKMQGLLVESGTLFPALDANQRAYSSMSDSIITRVMVGLDGKDLVQISSGFDQQEWSQWLGGNIMPVGYNEYNFCRESGNPDSGFPAETLTAARRFEIDGDWVGAAGQGSILIQDEILGTPALSAATSATGTTS